MKKFLAIAVLAAMSLAPTLRAADPPAPTEVKVCPMAQKAVEGEGAGNVTFRTYKVFFCCGGCKGNFAKLSDDDKQKKVDAALKKQNGA